MPFSDLCPPPYGLVQVPCFVYEGVKSYIGVHALGKKHLSDTDALTYPRSSRAAQQLLQDYWFMWDTAIPEVHMDRGDIGFLLVQVPDDHPEQEKPIMVWINASTCTFLIGGSHVRHAPDLALRRLRDIFQQIANDVAADAERVARARGAGIIVAPRRKFLGGCAVCAVPLRAATGRVMCTAGCTRSAQSAACSHMAVPAGLSCAGP